MVDRGEIDGAENVACIPAFVMLIFIIPGAIMAEGVGHLRSNPQKRGKFLVLPWNTWLRK
jgi:hypothetical protein